MKLCRCGRIVNDRCMVCSPLSQHARTTKERGYDNRWKRLSVRVRTDDPLCVDCLEEGRSVVATEVHHIVPIASAPHLRLARSNLVALCTRHHLKREMSGK